MRKTDTVKGKCFERLGFSNSYVVRTRKCPPQSGGHFAQIRRVRRRYSAGFSSASPASSASSSDASSADFFLDFLAGLASSPSLRTSF
jgi:hypothetical protein